MRTQPLVVSALCVLVAIAAASCSPGSSSDEQVPAGTLETIIARATRQSAVDATATSASATTSAAEAATAGVPRSSVTPDAVLRSSVHGLLDAEAQSYPVEIATGRILSVSLYAGSEARPMEVTLQDPAGQVVWQSESAQPGADISTTLLVGAGAAGVYTVEVSGGPGEYVLTIELRPQNDAGSGEDAGDTLGGVLAVTSQQPFSGQVGGLDSVDWYHLPLPPGSMVTLTVITAADAQPLHVQLLKPDQSVLWEANDLAAGASATITEIVGNAAGGTYFLGLSGGPGSYTVALVGESQDDAGSKGDAGDTPETGLEIEAGVPITGSVGGLDASDWFRLQVITDSAMVALTFQPAADSQPLSLTLLDREGAEVWRVDGVAAGSQRAATVLLNAGSGYGMQFLGVSGVGHYELRAEVVRQNDAGSGGDANDDGNSPLPVAAGTTYQGRVGNADREDWYRFTPNFDQHLRFTVTAGALSVDLVDGAGNMLWSRTSVAPGSTVEYSWSAPVELPYVLRVYGGTGSYAFTVSQPPTPTAAPQNDAGSGADAPDTVEAALDVPVGQQLSGQVGAPDAEDWYRFTPAAGQVVRVMPRSGSAPLSVQLYDAQGALVWERAGIAAEVVAEFPIDELKETPYTLRVHAGAGAYIWTIANP